MTNIKQKIKNVVAMLENKDLPPGFSPVVTDEHDRKIILDYSSWLLKEG